MNLQQRNKSNLKGKQPIPQRKPTNSVRLSFDTTTPQKTNKFLQWVKLHKVITFFCLFLIIASSVGGYFYYKKIQDLRNTGLEGVTIFSPFNSLTNVLAGEDPNSIKKLNQTNGRTNFLLLGVDARETADSLNTDSIMIISYDHNRNEFVQVSFPRDLEAVYKLGNTNYDFKINSVFPNTVKYYSNNGKVTDEGIKQGFQKLGEELNDVSGLDIHYGIMINFQGFHEIIDTLGGVEVNVENGFYDCGYPNEDNLSLKEITALKNKYQCPGKYKDPKTIRETTVVDFPQGKQKMNGKKALQYARSRHSADPSEGTDFARARRQQLVINAIKDTFINSNLFGKLDSLNQFITTLSNNIKFFNIKQTELDAMISSRTLLKSIKTSSLVLSNQTGNYPGHLLNDNNSAYILKPVTKKDYSDVKTYINFYLNHSALLQENPTTKIAWTAPKRQSDFNTTVKVFKDNIMKHSANTSLIKVTPSPTPSSTVPSNNPSPTTKPAFGTIYKLTDKANGSVTIYKEILKQKQLDFVIKEGNVLPTELEKLRGENDVLIVID